MLIENSFQQPESKGSDWTLVRGLPKIYNPSLPHFPFR